MTPPASARLPEAVEQDRDVYDLLTPDGRGQAYKREALARLLAKVGAARERQGIERAAAVCDSRSDSLHRQDPMPRIAEGGEAKKCASAIRSMFPSGENRSEG